MWLNLFIWRQFFAENGWSSNELLLWRHWNIDRFLGFNESLTLCTTLFYCEFYPWGRSCLTIWRLRLFVLQTWMTVLSTMSLALRLLLITFDRVVFMLRLFLPFCFSLNERLHVSVNGFEILLFIVRRLFSTDFFRGFTLMLILWACSRMTSDILLHVTIDFLKR